VSEQVRHFDFLILGAGPAGHKAATQAARAGKTVLVVDREPAVGGECVHRGTIPSKTLRETACYLLGLRARTEGAFDIGMPGHIKVGSLMRRLSSVRKSHEDYLGKQLERLTVVRWRGRARFVSPHEVEVRAPNRSVRRVTADFVVIATGSRPRKPDNVPIDHEHVLDSDSILSLIYLPQSLVVLGGGVIASEFASVFQALGTEVTMIDSNPRPLGFLDPELTTRFRLAFERMGGRILSEREIDTVHHDGQQVVTRLSGGEEVRSEKLLCALGRVANVADLQLEVAGVEATPRGHIRVDEFMRSSVPHVYAAGDVVGPPALAATAVEQGRRAVRHALGLPLQEAGQHIPAGIYTIPEIASVGLSEAEAEKEFGRAVVGRATFQELARAHINGQPDGILKLIADPEGRIVGVQIIGESATELVHLGQMALVGRMTVDTFVDHVFNFPTMAEAYRVAAIDAAARLTVARAA
jgi:NAD(P) transhydrogenase